LLDSACVAAEAARAMSGVEVVVLKAELPRRMSNHFIEDLLAASLEAQQSAQRQLGSAQHVVATLALTSTPLDVGAERRTSGTAMLISVSSAPAAHHRAHAGPRARSPDGAAQAGGAAAAAAHADRRRQAAARLIARSNQALAHLLGVEACRTYRCSLAAEAHNTCAHLCPICLRKVPWMTPASLPEYYDAQRELFCRAAQVCPTRFAPELQWLETRTRFLFKCASERDSPEHVELPTAREGAPTGPSRILIPKAAADDACPPCGACCPP
jgi:hypothetical protein